MCHHCNINMEAARASKWKRYWKEGVRVMRLTKRPNKDEFLNLTKVTGIGCAIIGIIGFVIFLVKQLLF